MKQPSPSVTTTRLFRNGNSQAVRIPKALAFDSVDIFPGAGTVGPMSTMVPATDAFVTVDP